MEPSLGSAKWPVQGLPVPRTEGGSASSGVIKGRDLCGVTHRSQHPAEGRDLPPAVHRGGAWEAEQSPGPWARRMSLARRRRRQADDGKTAAPVPPGPARVLLRAASPGLAPRLELSLSSWSGHVEPPRRPPQGSRPCRPGGPHQDKPGLGCHVADGVGSGPSRLPVPWQGVRQSREPVAAWPHL